jgi:hypothetical protein
MSKLHCILKLALCLLLSASVPGCKNPIQPLLDQVDQAIYELKQTRKAILADSQAWKEHCEKLLDQTDGKVRAALEDGVLGKFIDGRVRGAIDESKTTLVMVERRLLGYLSGVIRALEQKREEMKSQGGVPSDTIESILAEVIASVDDVEPFAGVVYYPVAEYVADGDGRRLLPSEIGFGGFGFDGRQVELVGCDKNGQPVWKAAPHALTIHTDFRITFLPAKAGSIDGSVEELALMWEGQKLATVALRPTPPAPPKPKLTNVSLGFYSAEEKYPFSGFNAEFGVYAESGKTPLATWASVGAGEHWKPGSVAWAADHALDSQIALSPSSLTYVEVSMDHRDNIGEVLAEYRQTGFGLGTQSYFSGNHKPRFVYDERELFRMGFVRKTSNSVLYELREPIAMLPVDWKGRIRVSITYGGKVINFDESPEVVFRKGQTPQGSLLVNLHWSGNGLIKE